MFALRILLLLSLLAVTVQYVYAGSPKTFEFGKESEEVVTVCLAEDTALSVMDAFAAYGDAPVEKKQEVGVGALALLQTYASMGVCQDVPVLITYTGTIREYDTKDGHHLGVFSATVRGYNKKVFIPLIGYTPLRT